MIADNGLLLDAQYRGHTKTITIALVMRGGLFNEDSAKNGLGTLFARTWLKSAGLLEKCEYHGAVADCSVSRDFLDFYVSMPSDIIHKILPILNEQFVNPKLIKDQFETEKSLLLDELSANKDDAEYNSSTLLNKALYPSHCYGMPIIGTPESVNNINFNDITEYFDKHFNACETFCSITGNFSDSDLSEITALLSRIKKGNPSNVDCKGSSMVDFLRTEKSDPRIEQSKLFISYNAPKAASQDYAAVNLAGTILGSGMSSIYFKKLRKDKGFAYYVGTNYSSRLCTSRFTSYIGLMYSNVDEAIDIIRDTNLNFCKEIADTDLEKAKNYMVGSILAASESNHKRAIYSAFYANLGLGFDHLEKYIKQIREFTMEDVEIASKIFNNNSSVFIYKP